MKYFRERHNLKTDYSGYEEVSDSLRNRLNTVCQRYIAFGMIGAGQRGDWIPAKELKHELAVNLEQNNIKAIILGGSYDSVFEAIEIYLDMAREFASSVFRDEILPDFQRAFELSGSVYHVDESGRVNLKIDEKLSKDLKEVEEALSETKTSYELFFETVGKLMSRKYEPKNIVKDIFIAFESYLKEKTSKSNFGESIHYLEKQGIINKIQRGLLEKIYAYRSDAFAVTHAGASKTPSEIDALWFLETVVDQLKFLDRKLKQISNTISNEDN